MHKVYIAAPLFNPAQIEIIESIEELCYDASLDFYSPRLHSGSSLLSPEDRRHFEKWTPVFESNEQALHQCDCMIAVLEYAQTPGFRLGLEVVTNSGDPMDFIPLEIPDTGVVWEMGVMNALNKPVFGYHSTKQPEQMNLMLTHSLAGMLCGKPALEACIDLIYQGDFSLPSMRPTGEIL